VLVKGSRGVHMEAVIDALRGRFGPAPEGED
jgi:UDP-N-acetylmuramyl pentapeptide synthase